MQQSENTKEINKATENKIFDIIVIGGGLSGFSSVHYILENYNKQKSCEKSVPINLLVLEAKNRVGGRLLSENKIELGATWTWEGEQEIQKLAKFCKVDLIPSHAAYSGEFLFKGGVQQIPTYISNLLQKDQVKLNHIVDKIQEKDGGILIEGINNQTKQRFAYQTKGAILAMPPLQIIKRIDFQPAIPQSKLADMKKTSTWMNETLKVIGIFRNKFWNRVEHPFYDLSQGDINAVKFFIAGYQGEQLVKKYNTEELKGIYKSYFANYNGVSQQDIEKNLLDFKIAKWSEDEFTYAQGINLESNARQMGYSTLRQSMYKDLLQFAGTETEQYHGHMEGAVISGYRAAKALLQKISSISQCSN